MKVQAKHGKVTQNMHGTSRNYRYVWTYHSHDYFIVFWERDITSEHHRTPVHISNTVYTRYQFSALFTFPLLSLSLLSRAFYPLYTTRPEELKTPLYSLGSKVICCV